MDWGDTWAFLGELNGNWGVAEFQDRTISLVYGDTRGVVKRLLLKDPRSSVIFQAPTLYSIDSFTLSLPLNRFYFEGQLESQGGPRVIGYGDFLYAPWFTGSPETGGADGLPFELRSPQGHDVAIEVSTNLTTWTTFTTLANPTGALQFNAPVTGLPHRFYRARTQ
jgi:hypothetical protein